MRPGVLRSPRGPAPNLFRLSDSQQSQGGEPSLSSFEAYQATYEQAREPFSREPPAARPAPSDAELQRAYEALRKDRIEHNRFEARRSLRGPRVGRLSAGRTAGLLLGVPAVLGLTHLAMRGSSQCEGEY